MKPLISVIVPVYRVERYLPKCIESIINQTYQNLEIIFVDDDSPDNCRQICDEYAQKDKRIRVFHKKHGGLSEARNLGIARANGVYLAFVDGDDWIEPNMYEVLENLIEASKADIVNCGVYVEYFNQTVTLQIAERSFTNNVDLCKALINGEFGNSVWHRLYHKSCFTDLEFPNAHVFEDIAILYRLFLKVRVVESVSEPLYHYRKDRKDSITQSRSMDNLTDFWRAHKLRYDYFLTDSRFNTDTELMDKLRYLCVFAVARTWRWCYACTEQEREKYASEMEAMRAFCVQNFPAFGLKGWPLHLRVALFIGRFNNNFAFALLYYMLRGYKWGKNYF